MPIFHSRKFWIAVFDVFISSLAYFIPKLTDPALAEHVLWLIAAWQPIFYALIAGTAQEDIALKSAGIVYDRASRAYISFPTADSAAESPPPHPVVTEPILIALISALFGGFLGNFFSYRLKKRTDYMDIVNTVLQRSDHDLKQWAERITRLESELDLKRQENTALEIKVEELARRNREKDVTISHLTSRVSQLEAEIAQLKGLSPLDC